MALHEDLSRVVQRARHKQINEQTKGSESSDVGQSSVAAKSPALLSHVDGSWASMKAMKQSIEPAAATLVQFCISHGGCMHAPGLLVPITRSHYRMNCLQLRRMRSRLGSRGMAAFFNLWQYPTSSVSAQTVGIPHALRPTLMDCWVNSDQNEASRQCWHQEPCQMTSIDGHAWSHLGREL